MEKETELPPIPDEACQGCAWRSRTIQKLNHEIRRIAEVTPRDSGQSLVGSIASLTQRLQASEAREAELKAEITMWRNRYEIMLHQRDKLQDAILLQEPRMEALERSLRRISDWCAAYPVEVFPEPDLEADRKLLGDSEFTRLNAYSMRHVVEGIAQIAAAEKL